MIKIELKENCCGCNACVKRCPIKCISFEEDLEGFSYPLVDIKRCINCSLCEKVCPVINVPAKKDISKLYAAIAYDQDVRQESSSGGAFSILAKSILDRGGYVFGAKFDEKWEVAHCCVDAPYNLKILRGSKYVQSKIGNAYNDTEKILRSGKEVLFVGTPCQIAGLKTYLRKDYKNLYTIDFICHGIPSPSVWRKYVTELLSKGLIGSSIDSVLDINFRAKRPSWLHSKIVINSKNGEYVQDKGEDAYFKAFNMNVTLRPICYECPFKGGRSGSDLTIADFWGIADLDSSMFDDKGTSMIIDYGLDKFEFKSLKIKEENKEAIEKFNGSYFHPSQMNGNRRIFFKLLPNTKSVIDLMDSCSSPTFIQRIRNFVYRKFILK